MAIVTFALVGLGVLLIAIGCAISVIDWNKARKKEEEVVTEGAALSKTLSSLAKLADALKEHPLGMQLVIVGIVVLIIAGLFGGIASL